MTQNPPSSTNAFGMRNIPSPELRLADFPSPEVWNWLTVATFALTYDGYAAHGSFEAFADTANACLARWQSERQLPEALDDLRLCLFFEQRRWRHFQEDPDGEAQAYITAILAAMRRLVARPGE